MVPESLRLYSPSVLKVVVFEARDQESIELFHKARGPLETERFESFDLWKVNVLGSFFSVFPFAWDAGTFGLGIDIPGWDRDFQRWRGEWLYVVHLFQLSMNFMEHFLHHDLIVVWTRNPSQTFEVLQGGGMLLIREVGHWVHFSTDIIANRADHQFRSQGCWGCSGLASYLMVQTVQNMPSVQPCCKVSLEQVPSEQVLGEHGHPDVQLWPAAVCWSMDHKVGSYSSNISRCLKMSQGCLKVSPRCLKVSQEHIQSFSQVCSFLKISVACCAFGSFASSLRVQNQKNWHDAPYLHPHDQNLQNLSSLQTLVTPRYHLQRVVQAVRWFQLKVQKECDVCWESVAIQNQPSSVNPAKGLRSPNWDLSNSF